MDGNVLILDDGEQTLEIPFAAEVRGSAAAETVQVPAEGAVEFGGNTGDRVEFARGLDSYDFTTSGNVLTVSRPDGARAEIALNADVALAFADGSTTAGIQQTSDGLTVSVGDQAVSNNFNPGAVALDGQDISGIADPDAGGTTTSGSAELAASFTDPSGVFTGVQGELRDSLNAAWDRWMDEFDIDTAVTIEAEVVSAPTLSGDVLARASAGRTVNTGLTDADGLPVHQQGPVAEMKTGTDPNGFSPDLRIEIPEVNDWTFNTELSEGVPAGQFDAMTVLMHEMGHALGFNGTHGTSIRRVSTFDTNVAENDEFFSDGLVFDGSNAQQANGGDAVPLTEGDPYHLADEDALMAPVLQPGESRDIGEVELAMLADAGVPVSGFDAGLA